MTAVEPAQAGSPSMPRKHTPPKSRKKSDLGKTQSRISPDGFFLTSFATERLSREATVEMPLRTPWGDVPSEFAKIEIGGEHYWADADTGSLYFTSDGRSAAGGTMQIVLPQ